MKMIVAFCLFLISGISVAKGQIKDVMQSVVSVLPVWQPGSRNLREPEGSGIVVGDGLKILTAVHVVKSATSIRVRTIDGQIFSAKTLWRDRATDVAVLEISSRLKPVPLHSGGKTGEKVCAIGNAFGLGVSVSCGVISARQRTDVGFNALEDFIQTDASMNPGKSGGALVNAQGQVIGMLSAIFTKKSDANIGVNFVVSARLLNRLLKQRSQSIDAKWRQNFLRLTTYPDGKKTGKSGARVVSIKSGSAASSFGLQTGDIIIQAGARRVKAPKDFTTEFAVFEQQDMPVTVLRNNAEIKLNWKFK